MEFTIPFVIQLNQESVNDQNERELRRDIRKEVLKYYDEIQTVLAIDELQQLAFSLMLLTVSMCLLLSGIYYMGAI